MNHKPDPESFIFTGKKPPGEDFFLVEVSIDNPNDPCWNEGFSIHGPWDPVMATFHAWMLAHPEKVDHVGAEFYQGEAAREKRLAILETEIRYRDQMRSQPDN